MKDSNVFLNPGSHIPTPTHAGKANVPVSLIELE